MKNIPNNKEIIILDLILDLFVSPIKFRLKTTNENVKNLKVCTGSNVPSKYINGSAIMKNDNIAIDNFDT
tara:strand:- start:125 stop:334 length:210 start_codon:yes stop_codon:yes gene_type:complete